MSDLLTIAAQQARRLSAPNARCFFASGRTELGGNHTDHNHGKVLAAAINLAAVAAVVPQQGRITVASQGWPEFSIDLDKLEPQPAEVGTTSALVRGVVYHFAQKGWRYGGFRACVQSSVLSGSGLSSSAAFEVLVGAIVSGLYHPGVSATELAKIGQAAENQHFGKPCGLMDQTSSAVGGVVAIDFKDPASPCIEHLDVNFADSGYALVIVNTGGSHADLTEDYAAIGREMRQVAAIFGHTVLRDVPESDFYNRLPELSRSVSHRAVLRALHYFEENHRVDTMVRALKARDWNQWLQLVRASGQSSFQCLQNVAVQDEEQQIPLALGLTQKFLGQEGACRVHGGGFAGTIQAYIPIPQLAAYRAVMEPIFGAGSVTELQVQPLPAGEIQGWSQ